MHAAKSKMADSVITTRSLYMAKYLAAKNWLENKQIYLAFIYFAVLKQISIDCCN